MSDSDQTWNAAGESWPPAPAPAPAPSAEPPPTAATEPTQPQPAAPMSQPAAPMTWPPQSASPWPTTPPGPPHATPPTTPRDPWIATPPTALPADSMSPAKRVGIVLAALLLVIASAGVGAAVANSMHKNSSSNSAFTNPFNGSNGSSSNPLGGGNNGGNGSTGSGSLGNGSGASGSGSSSTGALNASAIATKVTPSIVNVNTTLAQGRAAGTGIIISSNGLMLTNNHVIADATSITVDIGGTGNTHSAKVVGYDVADDVALVQIEGVKDLPVVTFGDPSSVNVGDPVVAIGNALGQGGTPKVATGKVTALNQTVTAGDQGGGNTETLRNMIQTDAPIQPGDSGGALIDATGKVIGINTAAAGGQGRFNQQSGSNIGFAIPIDNAVSIARQIQNGDETNGVHIGARGLLGVSVQPASDPSAAIGGTQPATDNGALVTNVQSGGGASAIGIKNGDVITAIDGAEIKDDQALRLALTKYHPGNRVQVTWVDSSGNKRTASAQLGEGPPA